VTIRDVEFRDIKTTTVTQMRGVNIRDKIIKDCILLGLPLTVGMYFSRTVSCLHQEAEKGGGMSGAYANYFANDSNNSQSPYL
jgi:hypothetical protein